MRRTSGWCAVLLAILLFGVALEAMAAASGRAPRPPDPGFYSPQRSPDGQRVLWECLERGGTVWLSGAGGGEVQFLVAGHSPSWAGAGAFRFVVSRDDGHQLLWQDLYEYALATGDIKLIQVNSGNPDYQTTLTGEWSGAAHQPAGALAGKTVCVDPGHGASSGANSPISGKIEDHYVLIMSYLARDYLEAHGATVRMTRFDNALLPGLAERVNFSNACGAASFNAVHLNSAANVNARGLELYFRSKDSVSQAQARKLHDAMRSATGIPSRGVRPDKETLGYTLAVLSENHQMHNKTLSEACFLTNAADVAMLERTACLDQWAWGIYAGTARTLGAEPMPLTSTSVTATLESFGSGPARGWIGGTPEVVAMETPEGDGSAALVKNPGADFTALRRGGAAWADYRVSATMAAHEGTAVYGLVARSNKCAREGGLLEGYLLIVDELARTASLKLSTGKPADAVTLASVLLHDAARRWHTLTLECRGGKLTATVDGAALEWPAPVPPESPAPPEAPVPPARQDAPPLLEGKAGVLVQSGAAAHVAVDRFAIEPLR